MKRFLIVEDDDMDRELVEHWLDPFGIEMVFADTVAKAMNLIQTTNSLVAIFVDLKLGQEREAGLEIVKYMSQAKPEIPTFIISGHDDGAARRRAAIAGASGFFSKDRKSIDRDVIGNMLRSILATRNKGLSEGMKIRHWRTSLAGACAASGFFLFGAPTAMNALHFSMQPTISGICTIVGLILGASGLFCGHIFSPDKSNVDELIKQWNAFKPK